MFGKVLVANRGEIAVRILRGLREMGIRSAAVYSDVDRAALHVRMADEAIAIGPAPSRDSYLNIDRILDAAAACGAEAIHPGYGFLSENAEFAAACESRRVVFIGPSAAAIRAMGSKTQGRRLAKAGGAPTVPGTESPIVDLEQARRTAGAIGYPILLKAAAGGGGKGMRRVNREEEFEAAFRDASSEAERAFQDGAVYIEKLVENPRHIEIQVFGDQQGNLVHLGERECSIQRRHQKVIEESPSPLVTLHPELRQRMGEAAVAVARAAGYSNAGTVEFLVDGDRNFYFLEMNTRLQVEHPITELVTGLDLVHLQLRVAAGEKLPMRQEEVCWRGSAMECRIYAEDPDNHFFPSPGRITQLSRPFGPGVRLDSGVYPGWVVPMDYDPLLAKLIVWGGTRDTTIRRMMRALDEYFVAGIKTNVGFFRQLLDDSEFRLGHLHTGFIEQFFARRQKPEPSGGGAEEAVAALAAAHFSAKLKLDGVRPAAAPSSRWLLDGRAEGAR
ncbi:MAG: acetyl-CoA carboxylase biotin carboxylase subunit [Bryobacterales bacterium]|nr:acetyl-CoA carboxylase biotin carboxylase subunit [Bryobacterales bacterium]